MLAFRRAFFIDSGGDDCFEIVCHRVKESLKSYFAVGKSEEVFVKWPDIKFAEGKAIRFTSKEWVSDQDQTTCILEVGIEMNCDSQDWRIDLGVSFLS